MRALIIILSIHIFSVQTKLLYWINPEIAEKNGFSFLNFDEPTVLAMVFSLSYSIATAIILYRSNNRRLIMAYAVLDGLGVLLYYFVKGDQP